MWCGAESRGLADAASASVVTRWLGRSPAPGRHILRAGLQAGALTCLLALFGCGPNGLPDRGDRYVEAVAQALDRAATPHRAGLRRSVLPRRRIRILEVPVHRIGPFDFLALQGCELGRLAGHNTSALGRQMPFSLRLTHELTVLEVSDRCIARLSDDERRAELGSIIELKRADRGLHAWNAIWAGPEIEAYLSHSQRAALVTASGAGAGTALELLAQGVGELRSREADGRAVESALERLVRARPLGGAMRDLETATETLDVVSAMIEAVDAARCGRTEARLTRAFDETYLRFYQEPLGYADRRAAVELPRLRALADASLRELSDGGHDVPEAMQLWLDAVLDLERPGAIWPAYRQAVHRHVAAWRPVLVACGRLASPGRVARAARSPAPAETSWTR